MLASWSHRSLLLLNSHWVSKTCDLVLNGLKNQSERENEWKVCWRQRGQVKRKVKIKLGESERKKTKKEGKKEKLFNQMKRIKYSYTVKERENEVEEIEKKN